MDVFLFGCLMLAAYFIPTILANYFDHHNTSAIFILNLFLGWTLLGWVGALVWAFMESEKK